MEIKQNEKSGSHQPRYAPYLLESGQWVRTVLSQRAGGLLITVNMNPDQRCNFDCLYCEVRRSARNKQRRMNAPLMGRELREALSKFTDLETWAHQTHPKTPHELFELKGVALSGDGEPTLCPKFLEVVREVLEIRRDPGMPWFRLILVSNSTGLDKPAVRKGLELFEDSDEIWLKLDAGTPQAMKRINQTRVPLTRIMRNIRETGRRHPIVIQSLFFDADGKGPDDSEIDAYVHRLHELKTDGAQISHIQIHSVSRPPAHGGCGHTSLSRLSEIARHVREKTGLHAEVY